MQSSLAVILTSGVLLFLSEAMKCYGNDAFWFKMASLALALGFHFTVFSIVSASEDQIRFPAARRRAVAVVSLLLWLCVGAGGRAIGFV
jgi:Na+-transporting NADH:ubiquinone oxidoreductase subunit NqrB